MTHAECLEKIAAQMPGYHVSVECDRYVRSDGAIQATHGLYVGSVAKAASPGLLMSDSRTTDPDDFTDVWRTFCDWQARHTATDDAPLSGATVRGVELEIGGAA